MSAFKRISNIAGWIVFAIAMLVYYFSAERTGSLWDCGEFILGAYKLQVVHPPGAPLFILIGRMFTWVADIFSNNPEDIAFAVNLMSGVCTAFSAAFVAWITIALGKLAMVGRDGETDNAQNIALGGAGIVAGLATAFSTSIWFSAVEGEVYAMSTFFTTLTLWATVKWYALPNKIENDRWLIFAIFAAGMSIGVHLLSILTFPALAMFFYFKRYKKHTLTGIAAAAGIGVVIVWALQRIIIAGIPQMWSFFELIMVNQMGLPFHSGLIPVILIIGAALFFGLRYAHQKQDPLIQNIFVAFALVIVAYSTYGVVVTRAIANPPINMNQPSDAMRLLPYLNREQYGERALLRGPDFEARPTNFKREDRYGRVGDKYEVVNEKLSYEYASKDKQLFPRMGDLSQGRPELYKRWMGLNPQAPLPPGRPNMGDNISFLWRYQINWMYVRYFMWNFSGRQNGTQGYYPWDKSAGHWITGIPFLDSAKLGNQAELPAHMKDKARNRYFMLPFLFGLLGLLFHYRKRREDFIALLAFFVITGLGIIIYSNQPPNEPRERDYVLIGSFFTYCIWMGMGVLAIFEMLRERAKLSGPVAAGVASALVMVAPLLMGTQNFDDHSRRLHKGSRDYASNFLQSCEENAIIFTYGDNDTYPLWYAQEVEGIRRDVRVVNLSLIAVDWYINQLRRKVNDSPAIKFTIPEDAYRGNKRNQVLYYEGNGNNPAMALNDFLRFIGEDHPVQLRGGGSTESYVPTQKVYLPVDINAARASGAILPTDTAVVSRIPVNLNGKSYLMKDEIAVLDILASNLWDRPIYFAVTTRPEKFFGMDDYMQLEGLALRVVPVRSASERMYGIIGSGRVNTEKVYENMMNKFRWGNFDKYDLYVDKSYGPSVQSQQLIMKRTADKLIAEGQAEKAIALADKYFEAFPNMNFPYDYSTYYMIDVYLNAGQYEKAKPHMEILANNTYEELEFYDSLDPAIIKSSYAREQQTAEATMMNLLADLQSRGDDEFFAKMQALFAPFVPNQMPQQPAPQTEELLKD